MTQTVPLRPAEAFTVSILRPGLRGAALGAVAALVAIPAMLPALDASMAGAEPKVWWYLSRAGGFVAYELMALSTIAGLLLSTKWARTWPGAALAIAAHQQASLVALGVAALHALALLGDEYAKLTLLAVLVPLAAPERPIAVALGQIALGLAAVVVASFYVRRRIGQRAWRAIHYATFASFALALAHGMSAGTDRGWGELAAYALPAAAVVFLTAQRLLSSALGRGAAARRAR